MRHQATNYTKEQLADYEQVNKDICEGQHDIAYERLSDIAQSLNHANKQVEHLSHGKYFVDAFIDLAVIGYPYIIEYTQKELKGMTLLTTEALEQYIKGKLINQSGEAYNVSGAIKDALKLMGEVNDK